MNAQTTINSLTHFCKTTSGDPFIWLGNSGTYKWSRSKETNQGIINGVVRKLAAIDVNGNQIWVVAGSLKIDHNGTINNIWKEFNPQIKKLLSKKIPRGKTN